MNWEVISKRELFAYKHWLKVYAEDVRLPDGRVIEGYLTAEAPSWTTVVALTPDERVVILRGYRHGPRCVTYSLPGGMLEDGEDPLAGIQRELLEETGYEADGWEPIGSFTVGAVRGLGQAHIYLARNARQVTQPDSGDLEETTVELHPLGDLMAEVFAGQVHTLNVAGVLAMASAKLKQ
ncbi:NUDIX hydrolase [Longispora albida]|uniref:NUDIX hydrolase n=1 Tax=Longispora albida TaxID=203523 RepID=UPI000364129C|nr:NUDIX hydrolase [Longispora albida]